MGPLAELPYRPHIQHADLGIASAYLRGVDGTVKPIVRARLQ